MSEKGISSPRSVSAIDAKSISIGSHPPATIPPVCTSPEAPEQSNVVHHPASPPGHLLLNAMWRSPDHVHQIGVWYPQKKIFKNLPINGVADAVSQALKLSSDGVEAYFACAEYLTPDNRVAANASGTWAFWMDIDCGEDKAAAGKGYPTIKDAEEALIEFCKDVGLPNPTHIIYSGGGLHAYWVLDDAVPRETWQSSARKLKGLTKARGFLADDSRTADIASVLRVPDTLNHKYTPPRPVTLEYASAEFIECSIMLDAIAAAYSKLCGEVATKSHGRPSIAITGIAGNADAFEYGPPNLVKLSSALATLEPDCDDETWKLYRLAPLAMEARNHPDYSAELYELARSWSNGELGGKASKSWITPGGNGLSGEDVFDVTWERFLNDKYTGIPVTLGTIYFDAMQVGWVDPAKGKCFDPEEHFEIIDVTVEGDA